MSLSFHLYVCKRQFEQTSIVGRSKQELSQTQIIPSSSGPTNTWQGSKGSTFDSMWVAEADGFFLANFQCLVVAHIWTATFKEELFASSCNTDVENQQRKKILHELHEFYVCKCHPLNFHQSKCLFHLFVVFDLSLIARNSRMVSCSKLSLWNMFVLSCRPLQLFSTRPTLIAPSRKLFDIVHRVWNFSKNWTPCSESLWHCTTHCVWNVVSGIVVSSHCFHMGVTNFAPHHVVCF